MPLAGSALAPLLDRGSQRAQGIKKAQKQKRGLRRQPGCPGALALAEGHLKRRERGNPSPQGEGAPQTPRPEGGRKDGQTNSPHTPRTTHSGNERGRGPRGDKTNRPHAPRGPPTNEPRTSEPRAKRFGAVRRSCGSIERPKLTKGVRSGRGKSRKGRPRCYRATRQQPHRRGCRPAAAFRGGCPGTSNRGGDRRSVMRSCGSFSRSALASLPIYLVYMNTL